MVRLTGSILSLCAFVTGLRLTNLHTTANPMVMGNFFGIISTALLAGLYSIGAAGSALAAEKQTETPGFAPLRVAAWNIEWFPGKRPEPTHWEEKDHIPLVQAEVAAMAPDILGMVEIRNEDAARVAVATVPGLKVDVCSRFVRSSGEIGMQQGAIASNIHPVSAWSEAWEPRASIELTRGFTFAAYPVGPDSIVLFYVVHLKSNRGEIQLNIPARETSTKQLLAHANEMEKIYGKAYRHVVVVLAGDFNTSLDDPRFQSERTLRDIRKAGYTWTWERTPVDERITLPAQPIMDPSRPSYPGASFDHIFVRGAPIAKAFAVASSPLASDHRPVVADLLIPVSPEPKKPAAEADE